MTFHYRYRKQIIISIIAVLIISVTTYFSIKKISYTKKENKKIVKESIVKKSKDNNDAKDKNMFLVDIKGEVNVPGIYELEENSRVIDVINKAGGLTGNANTTVINLSKKITDEMVIIIYSNAQVEDFSKTKEIENQIIDKCKQSEENTVINDSCIDKNESTRDIGNEKVNINTAGIEELTLLPGIGESKAKNIIEYRSSNPFNKIEDIINVPGIGENLFAQIKEFITAG